MNLSIAESGFLTNPAFSSGLMEAVIFAKPPLPGEAKSRLARAIGEQAAAAFARAALIDTITRLRSYDGLNVNLSTSRQSERLASRSSPDTSTLAATGDLGLKMTEAVDNALSHHSKVTLWGADAPHFESACPLGVRDALDDTDVVLYPASDGGFYALGTRVSLDGLLTGIGWSTDQVCRLTQQACEGAGLSVRLLYPNFDIDHVNDLERLVTLLDACPGRYPKSNVGSLNGAMSGISVLAGQTKVWYPGHNGNDECYQCCFSSSGTGGDASPRGCGTPGWA